MGASLVRRRAIGIELEPRWIEIYREVCKRENLAVQTTYQGDSRKILGDLADNSIDLVLTDVPYWNMDKLPKSTGFYKKVGERAWPRGPEEAAIKIVWGSVSARESWVWITVIALV